MIGFEILATVAVMAVMFGTTYSMVDIMKGLDRAGVSFILSAWISTAWGALVSLAGSAFLLEILRKVCGA
jgi:hypothetical protein